jgi:hypothetical protein
MALVFRIHLSDSDKERELILFQQKGFSFYLLTLIF